MPKRSILDATDPEFAAWLKEQGAAPYRARQVSAWIFQKRAVTFDAMTDLPAQLRQALSSDWDVFSGTVSSNDIAPDGTEKLLITWPDARQVECVLLPEVDRHTVCISTQVGCGMRCVFCASGLKGVERNLTSAEILEQVLRARNRCPADASLTNIVVMGMGESLANLDNLIAALDRVCAPDGLGLSPRRVTISTVGLPDKMRALAELDRGYHLAVSLHAPTEELRNELVPINDKVGLNAVMDAADAYFARTGRQITYEYVLLHDVNDRVEHARALGRLLAGRKAHVNAIPYNPVAGLPYKRPDAAAIRAFVDEVERHGVSITVRKTKGRPIDAACGQLRRRLSETPA